ncbi:hypothetical protein FALBO_3679 [Fusarium albosuccineum]|uniref:Uncharacterized protein n=1 Tax=Fusarium albosuccineum TaxID=1237068 RepID=A0A8H4LK92_9HYPO|nr:hypothetical protein FALBO_3679 [Fusarium albosuccineum]
MDLEIHTAGRQPEVQIVNADEPMQTQSDLFRIIQAYFSSLLFHTLASSKPSIRNLILFPNRKMPGSSVQHHGSRPQPSTPFLAEKPLNTPRICAPDPRQRSPHIDWC